MTDHIHKFDIRLWIPTIYFAMGMPFVAISTASVLMFTNMGISNTQITFWTSLIMLPWTLKPLWSPLLEIFKTKKFFVVATELLTGVTFGIIAITLHLDNFFPYIIALLAIVAMSGATHDIVGDGVYLSELDIKNQSKYIGWQGAYYNIAKILTGGVLIYLAGKLEEHFNVLYAWVIIMFVYCVVMIAMAVYHYYVLPGGGQKTLENRSFEHSKKELWEVIRSFFTKKHIWVYISFIIFYRFSEGFAIKVAPLFFRAALDHGGLGMSTAEIGLVYGTAGTLAFVFGSLLSGYFISRRGLKKTLFILCLAFNLPFVVYTFFAFFQPQSLVLISAGVVVEYFGYGFGFVGLTLFMMQQIAPGKHKMAHYAFATGVMNLGVMIPGMISGYLSDFLGFKWFFVWVLIATVPALLATYFVPFTYSDSDNR
jgi:PAT family beta-lactamase induction signal transducer AmpG